MSMLLKIYEVFAIIMHSACYSKNYIPHCAKQRGWISFLRFTYQKSYLIEFQYNTQVGALNEGGLSVIKAEVTKAWFKGRSVAIFSKGQRNLIIFEYRYQAKSLCNLYNIHKSNDCTIIQANLWHCILKLTRRQIKIALIVSLKVHNMYEKILKDVNILLCIMRICQFIRLKYMKLCSFSVYICKVLR